jgi:hypothetical protein
VDVAGYLFREGFINPGYLDVILGPLYHLSHSFNALAMSFVITPHKVPFFDPTQELTRIVKDVFSITLPYCDRNVLYICLPSKCTSETVIKTMWTLLMTDMYNPCMIYFDPNLAFNAPNYCFCYDNYKALDFIHAAHMQGVELEICADRLAGPGRGLLTPYHILDEQD